MLGVWLAIPLWALSYASQSTPVWNAYAVGVIISVAAVAALVAFQAWEEWVNAALAAWLIVSPYALGIGGVASAFWNQLIVGVLVGALAIWVAVAASDGARVRT